MKIDKAAETIKKGDKAVFLSNFFKKNIIKRFNSIEKGSVILLDNTEKYSFGELHSDKSVEVRVLSPNFYVLLGSGGLMGAAEAYTLGYWKCNDLVALITLLFENKKVMDRMDSGFALIFKPINSFIHWLNRNSLKGSKKNIISHYDLSNEFYQLWLDETMTYSCGFFKNKNTTMKEASIEKLDRLCRKLDIRQEDSILEIGTGWGSFAIYAAKTYGCNITTTTISDAQYELAKKRICEAKLEDKIKLIKQDYRNLDGKFDKIISIEMIEAVGHEYVPTYLRKVSSLLKDDGLFAMQGITYNDQNFDSYKTSVDFIKKYIFPGSCLISISQITDVMKKQTDLSLSHLEDITLHYASTLKEWRKKFLSEIDSIKKLGFSEEFMNMWEFYLVYCEAGFRLRNIGDYQFVFAKSGSKNIKIEY